MAAKAAIGLKGLTHGRCSLIIYNIDFQNFTEVKTSDRKLYTIKTRIIEM